MHSTFYVRFFSTLSEGYTFAALGDWRSANLRFDFCKTLIATEINNIDDMNTANGLQLVAYMTGMNRDLMRVGDAVFYEHARVIDK